MSSPSRHRLLFLVAAVVALTLAVGAPAHAQTDEIATPRVDGPLQVPTVSVPDTPTVSIDLGEDSGVTKSVAILLLLTVGAVLPGLLLVMTSFTRYVIVLGITKNALGLQTIPPTQVLIGIALFLTIFTMGPTLSEVNEQAIQPLLAGEIEAQEALEAGFGPFREYMLAHTSDDDLRLFVGLSDIDIPERRADTPASVLVPAFVVSELRAAFLIGFVVFVPFLVIDLVVSAVLMSMGMMMLPPVFISLPLKLLLFVLVDGWSLIIQSLVGSVQGTVT
ncbi:MAG: flagellar type III secretion system pore protein FliP [Actinomycetes bacterium]|nr:flagellar biosynthetic protein FliP [Acidimicrobiia bacterium]